MATAGLVLAAGFETTVNLLGNGIALLDAHPDQRARLRRGPVAVVQRGRRGAAARPAGAAHRPAVRGRHRGRRAAGRPRRGGRRPCWPAPTATPTSSTTPTASTSRGPTPATTCRSRPGATSASARRWRAWRARSGCGRCSSATPTSSCCPGRSGGRPGSCAGTPSCRPGSRPPESGISGCRFHWVPSETGASRAKFRQGSAGFARYLVKPTTDVRREGGDVGRADAAAAADQAGAGLDPAVDAGRRPRSRGRSSCGRRCPRTPPGWGRPRPACPSRRTPCAGPPGTSPASEQLTPTATTAPAAGGHARRRRPAADRPGSRRRRRRRRARPAARARRAAAPAPRPPSTSGMVSTASRSGAGRGQQLQPRGVEVAQLRRRRARSGRCTPSRRRAPRRTARPRRRPAAVARGRRPPRRAPGGPARRCATISRSASARSSPAATRPGTLAWYDAVVATSAPAAK